MSKRILVVEDEEDNRAVICQILEFFFGQDTPIIAVDGHEAIRMAYEHQPELILLDLTLPKVTGWEIARSLKADGSMRDVPILALTAHAMVGDRERALEAGCDDYFTKPIEIDPFVEFLRPYLDDDRTSRDDT